MRLLLLLLAFAPIALANSDIIPKKAFLYEGMIRSEIQKHMPELYEAKIPEYIPSLIEHESCITLTHKRCWEPTSRLLSSREEGAGLGQLTRTFNEDGSIRFDSLSDLKRKYSLELKDLSWSTIYQRPDLQIRSLVLMSRDNYRSLYDVRDPIERLKMADAAYNGGLGGLRKERTACGLAKNCDPGLWDKNVEYFCLKSKKPLYGNRSACDINRHHVKDVFYNKIPKYKGHGYFE